MGRPIVASRAFVDSCPGGGWDSLGQHKVQGIAEPIEVFAPKREAQRAPEARAAVSGG